MKKNILHWFFALSMLFICLCLLPTKVHAASESNLTFTRSSDGKSYSVSDCNVYASGELIVPATYNGKPVTRIGEDAFYGCDSLTNVTIPDSVTYIGNRAFQYCFSLTSITIPDSITRIGVASFKDCFSLTSVHITDIAAWCGIQFGAEIITIDSNPLHCADNLYLNGKLITDLVIPDGVTSIGLYAFSGYSGLKSVTIPDSVTSIDQGAFYRCNNLISVSIGNGVTSISEDAFYGCNSLTYNVYGEGKYLGNATNPYYALVDTVTEDISSIIINDATVFISAFAFSDCADLTSITIPDSVTSVGEGAFDSCAIQKLIIAEGSETVTSTMVMCESSLQEVVIPDSVTEIGANAFKDCTGLTNIKIPDGVISIGKYAFSGCSNLTNIKIPARVTSIGYAAFYRCDQLTSIVIPDGVTTIGEYAFNSCPSLTSITIPDSVTSIGDYAFYHCDNLNYNSYNDAKYLGNANNPYVILIKVDVDHKSYSIHSETKFIASVAFKNCTSLINITIPDNVTTIGRSAFNGCTSLASITIPDSVTTIGTYAFFGCTSLTGVTIPHSVTTIDDYTFYDCTSLNSITIPDSVTTIGTYAFSGCTSLTSIILPKSVKTIGKSAFYECDQLEDVWYGGSEDDFKNIVGSKYFATWHYNYCGADSHEYLYACDDACRACGFPRDAFHVYDDVTDVTCNLCKQTLAPAAPDYRGALVTGTTVTLPVIEGYEYSMDATTWQQSNVFTGLQPATQYAFYQRVAAGPDNLASPASAATYITTNKYIAKAPGAPVVEAKTSTSVTLQVQTGCEYSLDGNTWQQSNVFTGLSPETEYTFFQRIAETDDHYASASSTAITVTTLRCFTVTYDALGGSNAPAAQRKDQGIDLVLSGTAPKHSVYLFAGWSITPYGEVAYQFGDAYKEDGDITLYAQWVLPCDVCDAEGTVEGDIFCTSCLGTGRYEEVCVTCNGLGFLQQEGKCPISNCYSGWLIDENGDAKRCGYCGGDGQSVNTVDCSACAGGKNVYDCFTCGGDGSIIGPKKCSNCNGKGSLPRVETQTPPSPTLESKGATTIILSAMTDCEYSMDGNTWQKSPAFTNLHPFTEYRFYARYIATSTRKASQPSQAAVFQTEMAEQMAPSAPVVLVVTDNKVVLEEVSGCEYSMDGNRWQTSGVFTDLSSDTSYSFYARKAATSSQMASPASAACTVKTLAIYTVVFQNYDGTILSTESYHYADVVTVPADPARPADKTYTYTFAGWDKAVVSCTGDATYTATYTAHYIDYAVTFVDEDGTVLSAKTYHWGDQVEIPADPAKAADHIYTYVFAGWDKDVVNCAGNATYTATYTPVYIDYTVTFQYEDGTVISTNIYHYGDAITIPADPEALGSGYIFDSWDKTVVDCAGDAVYTAVFCLVYPVGDFTKDNEVTNEDVIYLLWHTLFPESYPVEAQADFTGDGEVTNEDVIYLLWHTLFPESYPLEDKKKLV